MYIRKIKNNKNIYIVLFTSRAAKGYVDPRNKSYRIKNWKKIRLNIAILKKIY